MNKTQIIIIGALCAVILIFGSYKFYQRYSYSSPQMVVVDVKAIVDQSIKKKSIADIPEDKLEAHVDDSIKQAVMAITAYAKANNLIVFNKTMAFGDLEDVTGLVLKVDHAK